MIAVPCCEMVPPPELLQTMEVALAIVPVMVTFLGHALISGPALAVTGCLIEGLVEMDELVGQPWISV